MKWSSGIYSAYITIRNDYKNNELGEIKKELEEKGIELEKINENLNKIQSEIFEAEYKKYLVNILNIKVGNQIQELQNSSNKLLGKTIEVVEKINNPKLSVEEKIKAIRDLENPIFSFNRDFGEFKKFAENLNKHILKKILVII